MNVNDPRWASIDAFVEENRDNILRDITRLVAVPSVEGAPEPGAPFGPGPKAALAILSSGGPQNFTLAVMTGDEKMLTAAQGVGKKLAQRIILELKDKLAKDQSSFSAQSGGAIPMVLPGDKGGEAAAALAVLGYGSAEIAAALKDIDMDALPLEDIIRQALKKMMK